LKIVAEMADRLLRVAAPQVAISIKTRQNAWLHISSGDPHKATAVARSPVSLPSLPRKPIPIELTAKKLVRLALELPVDRSEQRKLLGFR
jgi:hypothetical protein